MNGKQFRILPRRRPSPHFIIIDGFECRSTLENCSNCIDFHSLVGLGWGRARGSENLLYSGFQCVPFNAKMLFFLSKLFLHFHFNSENIQKSTWMDAFFFREAFNSTLSICEVGQKGKFSYFSAETCCIFEVEKIACPNQAKLVKMIWINCDWALRWAFDPEHGFEIWDKNVPRRRVNKGNSGAKGCLPEVHCQ